MYAVTYADIPDQNSRFERPSRVDSNDPKQERGFLHSPSWVNSVYSYQDDAPFVLYGAGPTGGIKSATPLFQENLHYQGMLGLNTAVFAWHRDNELEIRTPIGQLVPRCRAK